MSFYGPSLTKMARKKISYTENVIEKHGLDSKSHAMYLENCVDKRIQFNLLAFLRNKKYEAKAKVIFCNLRISEMINIDWGKCRASRRLFLAQNGICPYCGEEMDPCAESPQMRVSRDHVYPACWFRTKQVSQSKAATNIVLAHADCNSRKGSRPPKPCEILFAEITYSIKEAYALIQE